MVNIISQLFANLFLLSVYLDRCGPWYNNTRRLNEDEDSTCLVNSDCQECNTALGHIIIVALVANNLDADVQFVWFVEEDEEDLEEEEEMGIAGGWNVSFWICKLNRINPICCSVFPNPQSSAINPPHTLLALAVSESTVELVDEEVGVDGHPSLVLIHSIACIWWGNNTVLDFKWGILNCLVLFVVDVDDELDDMDMEERAVYKSWRAE